MHSTLQAWVSLHLASMGLVQTAAIPCYLARILERGITFLLEGQGADGLWRDFLTLAGEGSSWPTGLIATELALAGSERGPLERAAKALLAGQHDDGGWGYHAGVPTDADSTACALLFLAAMGHEGSRMRRARACLARHQDANRGGVSTYRVPEPIRRFMGLGAEVDLDGWCSSHLEVTATAGRAFAASTSTSPGWEAEAAWRYVSSRQCADGSWASYWWVAPHYPTLQAVALAVEMGEEAAVRRAAAWTLRGQDPGAGVRVCHGAVVVGAAPCRGERTPGRSRRGEAAGTAGRGRRLAKPSNHAHSTARSRGA